MTFPGVLVWGIVVAAGAAESVPKAYISGREVRVLRRGQAVEFTGGVVLTRGTDSLRADRMISEETTKIARAFGRVHLRREDPVAGVRWDVWGDRGVYDTLTASGTLWGRGRAAQLRRTEGASGSAGPELTMEALRLSVSNGDGGSASGLEAWGKVHADLRESTPARRTRLWADRAVYESESGTARFWGVYGPPSSVRKKAWRGLFSPEVPQPQAYQVEPGQSRSLRGESFFYDEKNGVLRVNGGVRAVLRREGGP
jgi:hypothetical protein